jgi:hypothetical protein
VVFVAQAAHLSSEICRKQVATLGQPDNLVCTKHLGQRWRFLPIWFKKWFKLQTKPINCRSIKSKFGNLTIIWFPPALSRQIWR